MASKSREIIRASDAHYLAVGFKEDEAHLLKLDKFGLGTIWELTIPDFNAHTVYQSNHNYSIAGERDGKLFIVRFDLDGTILKEIKVDRDWENFMQINAHESGFVVAGSEGVIDYDFNGDENNVIARKKREWLGAFKSKDGGYYAWGTNPSILIKYKDESKVWTRTFDTEIVDVVESYPSGNLGIIHEYIYTHKPRYGNGYQDFEIVSNTNSIVRDRKFKHSFNGFDFGGVATELIARHSGDGFWKINKGRDRTNDVYGQSNSGKIVQLDSKGKIVKSIKSYSTYNPNSIHEYAENEYIIGGSEALFGRYYAPYESVLKWPVFRKYSECDLAPRLTKNELCAELSAIVGYPEYTWYKNGEAVNVTSSTDYTAVDPGFYQYSVIECEDNVFSNEVEVTIHEIESSEENCFDYDDLRISIAQECELTAKVVTSSPVDSIVWFYRKNYFSPREAFDTTYSKTLTLGSVIEQITMNKRKIAQGLHSRNYIDLGADVYFNGVRFHTSLYSEIWTTFSLRHLDNCNTLVVRRHHHKAGDNYTYQWYRDGYQIPDSNQESLEITAPGSYSVEVTARRFNGQLSNECSFGPYLIEQLVERSEEIRTLELRRNSCETGLSIPNVRDAVVTWYKDNIPIGGQNESSIEIISAGDYHAVAYRPCNKIYVTDTVTIGEELLLQPGEPIIELELTQNDCEATLNITDEGAYDIRWFKNGVLIQGQNQSSISLTNFGQYHAVAWLCGQKNKTDTVTINEDLFEQSPKESRLLEFGQGDCGVTLSVDDVGDSYISWYKNNMLITEETDASIVVTSSGNYHALAYNWCNITYETDTVTIDEEQLETVEDITLGLTQNDCEVKLSIPEEAYDIRWFKNDLLIQGQTQSNIDVSRFGDYHAIAWLCGKKYKTDTVSINEDLNVTSIESLSVSNYRSARGASITFPVDADQINWYKNDEIIPNITGKTIYTRDTAYYYAISEGATLCEFKSDTIYVEPNTDRKAFEISWTDLVRTSLEPHLTKRKTGGGWNAGGASENVIPDDEDGWIEFTLANSAMIGLSYQNTDASYQSIDYCLWVRVNVGINVIRKGQTKKRHRIDTLSVGDILRIEKRAGDIYFVCNGVDFFSLPYDSGDLIADASLWYGGDKIYEAYCSHDIPENSASSVNSPENAPDQTEQEANDLLGSPVTIFPNPASSKLYLKNIQNTENVSLYNLTGVEQNINWLAPEAIDVSNMKEGIYILQFMENGAYRAMRIVIGDN